MDAVKRMERNTINWVAISIKRIFDFYAIWVIGTYFM